ncbi:MAG: hypothetical protein M3Q27_17250, partial [Actinomycetota bacterium]|nr:hypothetical protein [Actinomycetota bacterium]
AVRGAARAVPRRRTRWQGQQGRLARRRRLQDGGVAVLFLVVQTVVWLLTDDWQLRLFAAVVGLLAVPVLVTVVFDRRS